MVRISDNADPVMQRLEPWRALRSRLANTDDPLPYAHDFAKASGEVFSMAVWSRIARAAKHHSREADLMRLARKVLN